MFFCKKLFFFVFLLGFGLIVHISPMNKEYDDIEICYELVDLPDNQTLKQRFKDVHLLEFAEKTKIISDCALKTIFLGRIICICEKALNDYALFIGLESNFVKIMNMRKPEIISLLLKDYPEYLEKLLQKI